MKKSLNLLSAMTFALLLTAAGALPAVAMHDDHDEDAPAAGAAHAENLYAEYENFPEPVALPVFLADPALHAVPEGVVAATQLHVRAYLSEDRVTDLTAIVAPVVLRELEEVQAEAVGYSYGTPVAVEDCMMNLLHQLRAVSASLPALKKINLRMLAGLVILDEARTPTPADFQPIFLAFPALETIRYVYQSINPERQPFWREQYTERHEGRVVRADIDMDVNV